MIIAFVSVDSHGLVRRRLHRRTLRSTLAKLPGHALFATQLSRTLRGLRDCYNRLFTILFVSLSHFGVVGSDLKRLMNSRLLVRVTRLLRHRIEPDSAITHLNNSRFIVLLRPVGRLSRTVRMMRHLRNDVAVPFAIVKRAIFASTDLNVTLTDPRCDQNRSVLHSTSGTVCHTGGRNRTSNCIVFSPTVRRDTVHLFRLRARLHRTVRRRSFILRCRPVVDLTGRALLKFRTLIQ